MPCALRSYNGYKLHEPWVHARCWHCTYHLAWVWKCDTVADATFQIMIMFNLSLLASTTLRSHVGVLWVASSESSSADCHRTKYDSRNDLCPASTHSIAIDSPPSVFLVQSGVASCSSLLLPFLGFGFCLTSYLSISHLSLSESGLTLGYGPRHAAPSAVAAQQRQAARQVACQAARQTAHRAARQSTRN